MSTAVPIVHDYEITRARQCDLPLLGDIELAAAKLLDGFAPAAVLNETTSEHHLQNALNDGRLWVALFEDRPVGFAYVEILEPDIAHLQEIDVYPDHGRRGLGKRLVAEVCRWAEQHEYLAVTLTTFRDVPWNMPFYARMGFEEVRADLLSPALQAVVQDEARRGLDPARRVAMKWQTQALILTPFTLRPSVSQDADEIARVFLKSAEYHAQLDPERYWVPSIESVAAIYRERPQSSPDVLERAIVLIAECNGEIIGFVDARLEESPDAMHRKLIYCHIAEIAVDKQHQNRGVGTQLLHAAEEWGLERGAAFASLEYHAANTRAAYFYEQRMAYRTASITAIKHLLA